jgi:hypothetical protein
MELAGVIESFIGTFTAGILLLGVAAYILKKKLGNTPAGMIFG